MKTQKDNLSLSGLSMMGKSSTRLRSSGSVSNKISTPSNTLIGDTLNKEIQDRRIATSNDENYDNKKKNNNDNNNNNNNNNDNDSINTKNNAYSSNYNDLLDDGQHSHSNESDDYSYITVYEAITQTDPIPIIPKCDASTLTEVLDENDVGPLITIPMKELREIKQHKSVLTKLIVSENKSLELIKNVCSEAKAALEIDEYDAINNLSEGIVLHSKLFEHALYLMEKQNKRNDELENKLALVENELSTKETSYINKIKIMQSDLNHEKSLLEEYKFTTNQENKFKAQRYDDQNELIKALNYKITSLNNHNDKLQEEILQFPRREEAVRAKFESELRLKNIEFSQKDAERRHLKDEMKSLLYWRNRVDALEAEMAELKLKQISLNTQKARGVYGAEKESKKLSNKLNKEVLGSGNFHEDEDIFENSNSNDNNYDNNDDNNNNNNNNNNRIIDEKSKKEKQNSSPVHKKGAKALVDRLHRQIESRDRQMAVLRGRLANVYANPLLNSREPEEDDDDDSDQDHKPKSKFREQLGKFDERDPYLGFESDFEFTEEEWTRIKLGLQPQSEYLSDNEDERKDKHTKRVQTLRDAIKQERFQQSNNNSNNINNKDFAGSSSSSSSSSSRINSSKLRRSTEINFNADSSPVGGDTNGNSNSNNNSSRRGKISLFKLEQPVVSYAEVFGLYEESDNNKKNDNNARSASAGPSLDPKNRILNPNLERRAQLRFAEIRANKSFSKKSNDKEKNSTSKSNSKNAQTWHGRENENVREKGGQNRKKRATSSFAGLK